MSTKPLPPSFTFIAIDGESNFGLPGFWFVPTNSDNAASSQDDALAVGTVFLLDNLGSSFIDPAVAEAGNDQLASLVSHYKTGVSLSQALRDRGFSPQLAAVAARNEQLASKYLPVALDFAGLPKNDTAILTSVLRGAGLSNADATVQATNQAQASDPTSPGNPTMADQLYISPAVLDSLRSSFGHQVAQLPVPKTKAGKIAEDVGIVAAIAALGAGLYYGGRKLIKFL